MIQRLLVVSAVFLAVLAATEIALRLVGLGDPPIAVRDEMLEYRLVPDANYKRWGNRIQINNHGFRAADHPEEVPGDEVRLLLIGDSIVYGNHFLDQDETIAPLLSTILSSSECKVRVIPMAVSSWGPVNQAAALELYGTFGASEVVLVLSAHDLVDTPTHNGSLVPYRLSPPLGAIGDFVEAVIERLFPPVAPKTPLPFEERVQASLAALDTILEHTEFANADLLLVYNADVHERVSGISDLGLSFFHWADSQNIETLNLGMVPGVTYRDTIHPDANGTAHIAQTLARKFSGLLKCDSTD